ncbi:hypothetical protein ACFW34_32015 [Streptomyces sp. NPDC058848]|uniref:hypothetical protein n=1 Tax=unclassified Streptomyces TaxID=2593676 RepID=UPI0036AEC826
MPPSDEPRSSVSATPRGAALLRLWLLKEACTQALGRGLRPGFTECGFGVGSGDLLAWDGRPAARGERVFAAHRVPGRYPLSPPRRRPGQFSGHSARHHARRGFHGAVTERPG